MYLGPSNLRCVGGPMHGRTHVTCDYEVKVPTFNLPESLFAGEYLPEPRLNSFNVITYVRQTFQQSSTSARRSETVLIPVDIPKDEGERLWLTLRPLGD